MIVPSVTKVLTQATMSQVAVNVAKKGLVFGVPALMRTMSLPSPVIEPTAVSAGIGLSTNLLVSLRGGGGLDLERVDLRLNSLEEYSVIASIILGAVIDIYSDTPREKTGDVAERVAQTIHGVCICVGFLAAVYTTVVFSLFGLYAKTALGTGDDEGYMLLLKATGAIRYRGFQAFMLCLISFNSSFLMNMFLNHSGKTRWIICALAVVGTAISLNHFQFIVNTAGQIIFR